MVLRSFDKLEKTFPDLLQIIMFYEDGTVFQTTFDHTVNIPKMAESFVEIIKLCQSITEFCKLAKPTILKMSFETEECTVIQLKLGEGSNIALFFKKEMGDLEIEKIEQAVQRIRKLFDINQIDLQHKEIETREKQLLSLIQQKNELEEAVQQLESQLNAPETISDDVNIIKEELEKKRHNIAEITREIRNKELELVILRKKLEEHP